MIKHVVCLVFFAIQATIFTKNPGIRA